MSTNIQNGATGPMGDPPRAARAPASKRGVAFRVLSWAVALLIMATFGQCRRPETWEALFPDYRGARARRMQEIPPPPPLGEPGLAPNPRPHTAGPSPRAEVSSASSGDLHPVARSAEPGAIAASGPGVRGRIVFDGPVPQDLRLAILAAESEGDVEPVDPQPLEVSIAEDGSFFQPLESARRVRLRVSFRGGEALFGPLVGLGLDTAARTELQLGTAALEGRIVDIEGRPVAGVLVRDQATSRQRGRIPPRRETKTSTAGYWRLEHLPAGVHSIESQRPGPLGSGWDLRFGGGELAPDERRTLDLGYSRTSVTWSGRLRLRTGAGIPAGGYLTFGAGRGGLRTRTACDAEGRFRVVAYAGTYDLECHLQGSSRDPTIGISPVLSPEGSPPVEAGKIVLERDVEADIIVEAGLISGQVTESMPEDSALQRRLLLRCAGRELEDPSTPHEVTIRLGSDGRFAPTAMPPGRYRVLLVRDPASPGSRPQEVAVVDRDGVPVELVLRDGDILTDLDWRGAAR